MALYIEAKVKYTKRMENGKFKKVTEPYLADALSCTEAEARVTKEVASHISGDFTVTAVKKTNIDEIFRDDRGDFWFSVKANFISYNEKNDTEKLTPHLFLVQAADFDTAVSNFYEGMKGTMVDFVIASVSETKIMDVFDAK